MACSAGSFTRSICGRNSGFAAEKERIGQIIRRARVLEYRKVARQRRDIPDIPAFELSDERRIDILIANAVRDDIEAGAHEPFRVCEVEEVRRDSEVALVRFVDQRRVGFGRMSFALPFIPVLMM